MRWNGMSLEISEKLDDSRICRPSEGLCDRDLQTLAIAIATGTVQDFLRLDRAANIQAGCVAPHGTEGFQELTSVGQNYRTDCHFP